MREQTNVDTDGDVSGREDDRGGRGSNAVGRIDNAPAAGDKDRSPQERLDARYQSDTRGEHRYDDVHQTRTEQAARHERDDLKQRLARRPHQWTR